jgi:hypothetical protein
MDPLSIFGAVGSSLQIVGMIIDFGTRILNKRNDNRSLEDICSDAKKYAQHLLEWEDKRGVAIHACKQLRQELECIVNEINTLKNRNQIARIATALRFHSPRFQDKFKKALEGFQLQMSLEVKKELCETFEKLEETIAQMKDLQATAETLYTIPWMNYKIGNIGLDIKHLSESIIAIESTIRSLQRDVKKITAIQEAITTLSDQVEKDGIHTRMKVDQLTQIIADCVEKNNALTKLEDELISEPEDITWYQDDKLPCFRIWDLEYMGDSRMSNSSRPSAQLDGIELTSEASMSTIDEIYSKRHIAVGFSQKVLNEKRYRIKHMTPYFALAKHDGYFRILRSYLPPELIEQCSKISSTILKELITEVNGLSQEYRYSLIRQYFSSHLNPQPFTVMQRSMLTLYMGKLEVFLSFIWRWRLRDVDHITAVAVSISR